MTEKKKVETQTVGSVWELGDGTHKVERPDGEVVTVSGDYVLTQPGVHRSGDAEVNAK